MVKKKKAAASKAPAKPKKKGKSANAPAKPKKKGAPKKAKVAKKSAKKERGPGSEKGAAVQPIAKKKVPPKARTSTAKKTVYSGPTQTITCEINHRRGVKLVWKLDGEEIEGGTFEIDRAELRPQADNMRKALEGLEKVEADYRQAPKEYAQALRSLAHEGFRFAKIVTGVVGSDATKEAAAPFRRWFWKEVATAPKGRYELLIIHMNLDEDGRGKYVAPWHLAFSGAADGEIDNLPPTPEAFSGFWCTQFRLAVVRPDHEEAKQLDPKLPVQGTRISAVLEMGAHRTSGMHQDVQSSRSENILSSPQQLLDYSDFNRRNHHFYYVLLEREGGAYKLGAEGLDKYAIEQSHQNVDEDRVVITMFDGDCIMRDRTDWVEPLLMRLRGGLITAETDITNPAFTGFGWNFMKHTIIDQRLLPAPSDDSDDELPPRPLADAIDEARHREDLWPRSLIYGFYCNARNVYLAPPSEIVHLFKEIDKFIDASAGGAT